MTHERIRSQEKYQDRTVQDWHYDTFPTWHAAIDVDLMGTCQMCKRPLYLIEATENRWTKPIAYIEKLSEIADVESLLVYHRNGTVTDAETVWPSAGERIASAAELEDYLDGIREKHWAVCETRTVDRPYPGHRKDSA